ncbi:MAG TPA: glycosyltransferase [Thermomicrobiaceae bacterium]|nr:glycosyltransferase [Thermomicrobiaceae bacterium]
MISVHTSPFAPLGGRDTGGLNVYVTELSRHLAERGVAVDVFTRRSDRTTPVITEVEDGVRLIQVEAGPAEPLHKDALFCHLPEFATDMAYFAIKHGVRYDAIHAHYWLSGWAGQLVQRYWDVPLVMMFHTLAHLKNAVAGQDHRETTLRLQVERRIAELADAVVAANPDERVEIIRRLNAPPAAVHTIPLGVDLNHFRPDDSRAARRALGLPDGPLVLYVGRIDPVKGIDTLFDAFARLVYDREWLERPPRLVFVGGLIRDGIGGSVADADLDALAARAAALGLSDHVLFHGAQPRERLPLYYNAVDVCAVPSRYESFGLVAVEAMACGTPVVASDVGGLRYSVEDEVSGLLVPHSDPVALSGALARALTDHDLRSRMMVGARQSAVGYSWHAVTSAVLDVYANLVPAQRISPDVAEEIYAS